MIVGALIALPTADFITVLIGIGIAMITLVVVITLTCRIINQRNIELSPLITMITGCGIGLLTGFLSVALFRFVTMMSIGGS